MSDEAITPGFSPSTHPLRDRTLASVVTELGIVIPVDVDLNARTTAVSQDRAGTATAVEARSANGTRTIIVAAPGRPALAFVTGPSVSLSGLPLIGSDIPAAENIAASVTWSSSDAIGADHLRTANDAIRALGTEGPLATGASVLLTMSFGSATATIPLPPSGTLPSSVGGVQISTTSDGTVWFTVQQTWGPVVFDKIGAKYLSQTNQVSIEIDASISVDAVEFDLDGLGVTFSSDGASSFSIEGAALSFDKSPLTLSGALINTAAGSSGFNFEGEVTVGTGNYTVQVAGEYSDGSTPSFSSAFLFADLATQFGGPPSFSVTAAALGGGFNSALLLPTIDQVSDFPFLQVLSNPNYLSSDPIKALNTMLGSTPPWVSASQGSWWIAAGINATSYNMIDTSALLVVEDASELVLSLIGKSTASFPSDDPYAYVELDLLAKLAPSEGVFSVLAQLAPSSYLLSDSCVLTGGFAFFDWFGSNAHAGDFVLTLGGYNPGFTPPAYYPSVPTVGFDWSLDSSISISGDAYFALTPAAFMVGGELEATYQSGNLQAWFDAHADVMVVWTPFSFNADIGINVGASYTLDLLFVTTTVTVELGCDLTLWGPPTGGTVSVDWSIISFTIPFGSSGASSNNATWTDVLNLLPQPQQPLSITPTQGLTSIGAPSSNGSTASDNTSSAWFVRAGQFAFNTSSPIPATSWSAGQAGSGSAGAPSFNVAPLASSSEWQSITATHSLTIADANGNDVTQYFTAGANSSNLPASTWGTSEQTPPNIPNGNSQVVGNLVTGLTVTANPPSAQNPGAAIPLTNLEASPLTGVLQFGSSTPSVGAPVNDGHTVSDIADPNAGIAAASTISNRTAIWTALGALAAALPNDPMTNFASDAGSTFAAEPMHV